LEALCCCAGLHFFQPQLDGNSKHWQKLFSQAEFAFMAQAAYLDRKAAHR